MTAATLGYIFLVNVALLWLFLGLVSALMFSRTRLLKKGHDEEYVAYLKKENRNRCLGIAIVIPLAGLLSAGVVFTVVGSISTYDHFLYVCLLTLVSILPFPVLDFIQSQKKQKSMIFKTKGKVVVDLNHRTWHLVFHPLWEACAAALVVGYLVWMQRYFDLAMLHTALLWLLYLVGRGGKYMTGPSLSDLYNYSFIFMAVNHLLVIFHLVRFVTRCCPEPGQSGHIPGIVLVSLLSSKLIFYFLRLPRFRRELAKLTRTAPSG